MLTIGIVIQDVEANMCGIHLYQHIKENLKLKADIAYFENEKDLMNALSNGTISVAPRPLRELSTKLPNGIIITAVSERLLTSESLIIPNYKVEENKFLSLKDKATISLQSNINRLQFLEFRSDLRAETHHLTPIQTFEKLQSGDFDACIISSMAVKVMEISPSHYTIIPFSPKEFITEPGHGIVAYLTAEDDLTTRRLLKPLHHPSVSAVSNVERRLKQLSNDVDIAAYCEKDRANNYHLWAAAIINNELKKTRLSQSTHFELAERCFEKLRQ